MAVLRVVSLLDAATLTGPAKNLIQLCRGVNASKDREFSAEISIATIRRGTESPTDSFVEAARAAGIEVDVLRERYRYDLRVTDQLRELMQRRAANIIETHGVRMHFLARLSGLAAKMPWIAFHHGYTSEDLKMLAYNQTDRWSLRKAARIFTDCKPFADQLAGFGILRERIRTLGSSIGIQDGASPQEVQALRERLGIGADESVILSIGRLSREKAQADLVAAASHLFRKDPNRKFRLVLVGDGPDRGRLQKMATESALSAQIDFVGHQTDVRPYYGIAQVFALPSLSEGSPNVLLEAMAAGVPIVSTSVGGVPEMVENERSAILVPPGKPEAMAHAIERLLVDDELRTRVAKNAAVIVRERFSPEVYRKTILESYAELSAPSCSR